MTVPGDVSAKKLAGDYLADLTKVALRYLPKGDRMKFIGRTQALIERRCGPLADADPERVAALLSELGAPRELVMRERERLDQAWAKRRSAARSAGASPAAPWEQRPITSRWRPATGERMRPPPQAGRLLRGKRARQDDPAAGPAPAPDQGAAAAPDAAPARARRWPGGPPGAGGAHAAGAETAGVEAGAAEAVPGDVAGTAAVPGGAMRAEAGRAEAGRAEAGRAEAGPAGAGAAEAGAGATVAAEGGRGEPAEAAPARGGPAAGNGAVAESAPPEPTAAVAAADRVSPDSAAGKWTPPVPAGDRAESGEPGQEAAAQGVAGQGMSARALAGAAADSGADMAGPEALGLAGQDADEVVPGLSAIEPTSVVPPDRPPPVPASAVAPGPPTIPGLNLTDDAGSEIVPARGPAGALAPLTPAGLAALARGHRREALAMILLGIGGLLLPLPFWPLGAAVAGFSRFWEARYRWVSLYGPVLVTLVLTVPAAAIAGGHGNVVSSYLHMLWLDARYLVRIGCVLTAAYLTWLVRRGPRERVPPWRR